MSVETRAVRALSEAIRDTLLAPQRSPACLPCKRDKGMLLSLFCSFSFPVPLRTVRAQWALCATQASEQQQLRQQQCEVPTRHLLRAVRAAPTSGSMGCWALRKAMDHHTLGYVGLTGLFSPTGDTSLWAVGGQLGKQLLLNYSLMSRDSTALKSPVSRWCFHGKYSLGALQRHPVLGKQGTDQTHLPRASPPGTPSFQEGGLADLFLVQPQSSTGR